MKLYVKNDYDHIIGVVEYNNILDNPNNDTNYHRGIAKLRTGEYVLIDSDETYYTARAVSEYVAFEAILESGHDELLTEPRFVALRKFLDDIATEV